MHESSQRPSSVPLCNLRADQCYGHSNEEATSQIAPQSPTEISKIRISAAPGVSFGSAATLHLSRSLRWLRVFTQFPPARSWPRSLPHHAPANIVHYTPSVIRPSWRQKSAPLNVRCSVGPDASVRAKPARRVTCDPPRTDGGACRCPTHSRSVAPAVALG